MLEGRLAAQVLEGMLESNPQTLLEHFAFGKRVWTRNAPTARARAAICVQRFDDSLNPAIHITYRVSRRSSSLREPRDPSLKGKSFGFYNFSLFQARVGGVCEKIKEDAGLRGHNADELKSPRRGLAYAVEMFVRIVRRVLCQ